MSFYNLDAISERELYPGYFTPAILARSSIPPI